MLFLNIRCLECLVLLVVLTDLQFRYILLLIKLRIHIQIGRYDIPSITLQVICDYKKKIIDIFTGAPGKMHDARIFVLSDISKELPLMWKTSITYLEMIV